MPNNYFPFPYIGTTFPNSAACASAVSECSANYGMCVTDLQGSSGYGVTVVVNGGTTVAAATAPNIGASATPVCSSLSSVACGGLQSTQCAQYGNAANAVGQSSATVLRAAAVAAGLAVAVARVI